MPAQVPYVGYLKLDSDPYLVGNRCKSCEALFLDRRNACARCGQRDFETVQLGRVGTIRSFTVVHRATPDVKVPYTSVIVDLDGGGTVKANLMESQIPATETPLGGRVRLVTRTVAEDIEGNQAIAYAFELESAAEGSHKKED